LGSTPFLDSCPPAPQFLELFVLPQEKIVLSKNRILRYLHPLAELKEGRDRVHLSQNTFPKLELFSQLFLN
jgi:hypothetical protein